MKLRILRKSTVSNNSLGVETEKYFSQLEVYLRYWNDRLVKTRFLSAEFLGHATADDVLAKLLTSLNGLNRKHMVQLSMDGLSVRRFMTLFRSSLR